MKVYLCVPTGNPPVVGADLTKWLLALKEVNGHTFAVEIVEGRDVVSSRNKSVKRFLASDCDVYMTIDDDMVPTTRDDGKTGSLGLLLEAIGHDDIDVVTGVYLKATDMGPCPILSKFLEDGTADTDWETLTKPPGLYEMTNGGAGGGCLMATRKVMERFREKATPWFKDVFHFDDPEAEEWGERHIGQDIWFFQRATNDLGFRCWVDTRVFWGHQKTQDLRNQWDAEQSTKVDVMRANQMPHLLAETTRVAWGNTEWTASRELLVQLLTYACDVPADQMIVECGSGLSTFILSQLVMPDRLLSLEHDESWAKEASERIPHLADYVEHVPLHDYGEYDWYKNGWKPSLPIGLLVVDGPPGSTKGGRYGALPQMYEYFAPRFRVILDDASRPDERAIAERWKSEYGLTVIYKTTHCGRGFAVMEGRK